VPVYYDLQSSLKGRVIEVALTKGSYCRKTGRQYEFNRDEGAWQSKVVGYVESTAASERCDGCVVGSVPRQKIVSPPRAGNLRLTGSVRTISCFKSRLRSLLLSLREGNSCNQQVGVEIGWDEIKRRTTPMWLRVSFEM